MILETHASEDKLNYLMLAQVQLPLEDAENEARHYEDGRSDFEGFGCADGKVQIIQQMNQARYMPPKPIWDSQMSIEGYLLSQFKLGSFTDDAQICLWDINAVRLQCRSCRASKA
ncbi:Hypothetical predicted protein [Olea europaea subsp. europaea]|uniref:Uncharacterized protein n=1 Tax=Olea europaea subsp. europaea TaxID=158383 RepID=A0A8S0QGM4_OLEEU|nr:Hypothetical predicted protein [Olea europaea subsp. europaea]